MANALIQYKSPLPNQYAYDCSHLLWCIELSSSNLVPNVLLTESRFWRLLGTGYKYPDKISSRLRRKVLWPETLVLERTWEINVVTWERGRSLTLNSAGKGRPRLSVQYERKDQGKTEMKWKLKIMKGETLPRNGVTQIQTKLKERS